MDAAAALLEEKHGIKSFVLMGILNREYHIDSLQAVEEHLRQRLTWTKRRETAFRRSLLVHLADWMQRSVVWCGKEEGEASRPYTLQDLREELLGPRTEHQPPEDFCPGGCMFVDCLAIDLAMRAKRGSSIRMAQRLGGGRGAPEEPPCATTSLPSARGALEIDKEEEEDIAIDCARRAFQALQGREDRDTRRRKDKLGWIGIFDMVAHVHPGNGSVRVRHVGLRVQRLVAQVLRQPGIPRDLAEETYRSAQAYMRRTHSDIPLRFAVEPKYEVELASGDLYVLPQGACCAIVSLLVWTHVAGLRREDDLMDTLEEAIEAFSNLQRIFEKAASEKEAVDIANIQLARAAVLELCCIKDEVLGMAVQDWARLALQVLVTGAVPLEDIFATATFKTAEARRPISHSEAPIAAQAARPTTAPPAPADGGERERLEARIAEENRMRAEARRASRRYKGECPSLAQQSPPGGDGKARLQGSRADGESATQETKAQRRKLARRAEARARAERLSRERVSEATAAFLREVKPAMMVRSAPQVTEHCSLEELERHTRASMDALKRHERRALRLSKMQKQRQLVAEVFGL